MAISAKLTQTQIDELKEKIKHFRHESGLVLVPSDVLNLLVFAYVVS